MLTETQSWDCEKTHSIRNATAAKRDEEERKLLGAINKEAIELFPYFGDVDKVKAFIPNVGSNDGIFPRRTEKIECLRHRQGR